MSDVDSPPNDDNDTTKNNTATATTAATKKPPAKKGPPQATQAEIQKSIERKKWVDRIAMVLLVSALAVYFIVLIIGMVSSANSTLVEKEDTEKQMNVPLTYIEFVTEDTTASMVCSIEYYVDVDLKGDGVYANKAFNQKTLAEGWAVINLATYASDSEEYNYTGVILTPPSDAMVPIQRNVQNYIDFACDDLNSSVYLNLYYEGQYDQYEEGSEETDAISYDAYECKLSFDTNFDLEWSTITDNLEFAAKPEELDGIEGAYDYYEMALSGVYPLSGSGKNLRGTATYAGYRKHTQYVYQDSTSFYDVIAAIGGMYTSLASILAWFIAKFIWGYDFRVYKWTGFAPYAPKTEKKEGEEKEEEEEGMDM
jgi:hypothetical protein